METVCVTSPAAVRAACLAKPKSRILTRPSLVIKMLSLQIAMHDPNDMRRGQSALWSQVLALNYLAHPSSVQ
jgi:hypothetical protein